MEISIIQAVLCGIVYWLAVGNLPFVGLWSLQRPLVCGLVTGLILGHPVQGAVIGATINLVYLGFMSAGGSMPADMALAGIKSRISPDQVIDAMKEVGDLMDVRLKETGRGGLAGTREGQEMAETLN